MFLKNRKPQRHERAPLREFCGVALERAQRRFTQFGSEPRRREFMNERVKQDWQLIGVECEETQVGRPTKDPHRHGPGRQKRETRDGAEEKGEDDEDESRRSCAIEQKNHLHSLSTVFGLRESEPVINL